MQIQEISQHNTKFWVTDDVYADFDRGWFYHMDSAEHVKSLAYTNGRAAVTRMKVSNISMILRHYYRGGIPAHFSKDRFVFRGYRQSRCYRELQLLNTMWEAGLPVPKPVAAKCKRQGVFYQADILMQEIENTQTLIERLKQIEISQQLWERIGQTISRLHQLGIQHVDLNANNVLINNKDEIFLIDFDRCKQRTYSKQWGEQGLLRLARSLAKQKSIFTELHYSENMFASLRKGYEGCNQI